MLFSSHWLYNFRRLTIDALLDQVHGYLAERFDTQRRLLLVG